MILLYFLLFFKPEYVLAQSTDVVGQKARPFTCFYNLSDGLPSNEVYDLIVDSLGRIWSCTDNGLSCFDGQQFRAYDLKGCSPLVLRGLKSDRNELWFFTARRELLRYDYTSDQLIFYPEWNHKSRSTEPGYRDVFIQDSTIIFIHKRLAVRFNQQCAEIEEEFWPNTKELEIHLDGERVYSRAAFSEWRGQANIGFYKNGEHISSLKIGEDHLWANPNRIILHNSFIYIQFSNRLVAINSQTGAIQVALNGIELNPSMSVIPGRGIVVGAKSGGAWLLSLETMEIVDQFLPEYSITSAKEGPYGALWFSTLEKGIAVIFQDSLSHFSKVDPAASISSGKKFHKSIYLGDNKGNLVRLFRQQGHWIQQKIHTFPQAIHGMHSKEDSLLIRSGLSNYRLTSINPPRLEKVDSVQFGVYRSFWHRGGSKYVRFENGTTKALLNSNDKIRKIRRIFHPFPDKVYLVNFEKSMFVSASDALPLTLTPDTAVEIRGVIPWKGDTVLAGTKGNGLVLIHREKVIWELDTPFTIVSNLVRLNGQIWMTTPSDLYRIIEIDSSGISVEHWNPILGIGPASQYTLTTLEDQLVLACSEGILAFNPQNIKRPDRGPEIVDVQLETADGKRLSTSENLVFDYPFTGISLYPMAVSYSYKPGIPFRYKINTSDSGWIATNVPIEIRSLSTGTHQITLQAKDRFGQWSRQAQVVTLEVLPPYWESWWFISLLVLMMLALIIAFYNRRIAQLRSTNQLKMEIAESRNQVMSLQLNPHFIFNSLHSVIASISGQNPKNAIRYLAKFARMMRTVFEHSQHSMIALEDELQAVRGYLELESIRLERAFDYRVEVETGLDTFRYRIPPMLIQPFVENAIWHGIVQLNNHKGEILVSIQILENESLQIVVRDNGPGEKGDSASSKVEKKRVSSQVLIRRRLELLNRMYKGTFSLTTLNVESGGYEIRLQLPLLEEHEQQEMDRHIGG